jgi:hypothetical protein
MPNPTRDTAAGRIYNDLRNLARRTGAPTDQVMLEYLLERFLYRVSIHPLGRQHFVLKGGLLLAQFGARRVTRDIDILGRAFPEKVVTSHLRSFDSSVVVAVPNPAKPLITCPELCSA